MPNIKSAIKRMRTSNRQADVNRRLKSRVTTARRAFQEAVTVGDKTRGEAAYNALASALDRAAKHGTIKRNKADRSKSRANKHLVAMG